MKNAVLILAAVACFGLGNASAQEVLEDFDQPFLFSYLSWEGKAVTPRFSRL